MCFIKGYIKVKYVNFLCHFYISLFKALSDAPQVAKCLLCVGDIMAAIDYCTVSSFYTIQKYWKFFEWVEIKISSKHLSMISSYFIERNYPQTNNGMYWICLRSCFWLLSMCLRYRWHHWRWRWYPLQLRTNIQIIMDA